VRGPVPSLESLHATTATHPPPQRASYYTGRQGRRRHPHHARIARGVGSWSSTGRREVLVIFVVVLNLIDAIANTPPPP